jgi:hypothetical protein
MKNLTPSIQWTEWPTGVLVGAAGSLWPGTCPIPAARY